MKSFEGVVIGTVTNVEDPSHRGQIKVRFPWLRPDHESDWIRIATLMSGKGRGSHFLPEIGAEVLVAFEHGDASFPYVIGFLWNGKDEPPNSDINTKVRRFQSVAGHIIEFENDEIEALQDTAARRLGFNVLRHRHELFGLCEKARGMPGGRCPGEASGHRGRS